MFENDNKGKPVSFKLNNSHISRFPFGSFRKEYDMDLCLKCLQSEISCSFVAEVKYHMRESSDSKSKCAPNFFHSNALPGNVVVASDVFVIIYSSLSLAFPPVISVFPWPGEISLRVCHVVKR